jgi:hypothetical protein
MFTWFKNIFGVTPTKEETLVLTQEMRVEETAKPKKTTTSKAKKPPTPSPATKKAPAAKTTEAAKKRGRPKKTDSL